jgi:hypothetical protein
MIPLYGYPLGMVALVAGAPFSPVFAFLGCVAVIGSAIWLARS